MFDYVGLETEIDAEERAIRDSAREFVAEHVAPTVGEDFLAGRFPTELIAEMGDRGFYAPNLVGEQFAGLSERAYGLMMQELAAGDSGIRSMASVQGSLVIYPIHRYGSEAQRERWLPDLAAGEAVGGFALTEPAHGSNPAGMETYATHEGDEYVLNGEKRWCTNSPIADVLVVWARTRADESTTDRSAADEPVRGFLVETDREGLEIERIGNKLSMRVSSSGAFTLEDVRIPEENVLPGVSGMKGPLSCLTQARFGIAWGAVGVARDCFEAAREYATEREQFGKPIGAFQLQQGKLAEMATRVTTAQLLAHRLAHLKEHDELRPQHVSMAKRNNVEAAQEVARVAREMLGGNGITTERSPMRHLVNMETVATYEGTHDIHSLILGEDLTGISAFE